MAVSRLRFLSASGAATASLVAGAAQNATIAEGAAALPRVAVGKAKAFQVGKPVAFHYPDAEAPALAVKIGHKVEDGVGPEGDIVAYSQLCVHRGCPVSYNAGTRTFVCPCHYSVYDPERSGQLVIGHATTNLPRITLAYDPSSDEIRATGVQGLIFGRFDNGKLG
jgi:arsenite oxidase small subunit